MATGVLLAGLLWIKGGQTPGRIPLVFFCLGNAVWILGHWLVQTAFFGSSAFESVGISLINLSPCVAAVYLHFALLFSRQKKCLATRFALTVGYGSTAFICLIAILLKSGKIAPWLDFPHFYYYSGFSWIVAFSTLVFSGTGHWVLFKKYRSATGKYKRQLLAVLCSGVWGLCASSGLIHASFGLNVFPYQVLLLPAYTLFLVYGILRYELMAFNHWFRLGLTWVLLMAVVSLIVTLLVSAVVRLGIADLPSGALGIIWVGTLISFLIAYSLYQPLQKLATRWVYPGAELDGARLDHWRERLSEVKNWEQLKAIAEKLFSEHVQQEVAVKFSAQEVAHPEVRPTIFCFNCSRNAGIWSCEAAQNNEVWSSATPGIRFSGEVFATILTSSTNQLQQALELADEKGRQMERSHLAALGQLSASIAHELRNPLNIISMANMDQDGKNRPEINIQLDRANRLVAELLDYAGDMNIHKEVVNISDLCATLLSSYQKKHNPQSDFPIEFVVDITPDLEASTDIHRIQQVIVNLIDNAVTAVSETPDPIICIRAVNEELGMRMEVCDNGCGIKEEQRISIFQPFSTGHRFGTGLGLAIVKRIMDAHNGTVQYKALNPVANQWFSSCFELFFPKTSVPK